LIVSLLQENIYMCIKASKTKNKKIKFLYFDEFFDFEQIVKFSFWNIMFTLILRWLVWERNGLKKQNMGPSEYGSFVVIYVIIYLIQGWKKKIRLKFLEEKVNDIYF
jgi:hypothetical protein